MGHFGGDVFRLKQVRFVYADYPTTCGAFDHTFNGGNFDAFVTKLP